MSYHNCNNAKEVKPFHCGPGKFTSTLAPASMDKSASSPAEILRNCVLDWAQRSY